MLSVREGERKSVCSCNHLLTLLGGRREGRREGDIECARESVCSCNRLLTLMLCVGGGGEGWRERVQGRTGHLAYSVHTPGLVLVACSQEPTTYSFSMNLYVLHSLTISLSHSIMFLCLPYITVSEQF